MYILLDVESSHAKKLTYLLSCLSSLVQTIYQITLCFWPISFSMYVINICPYRPSLVTGRLIFFCIKGELEEDLKSV